MKTNVTCSLNADLVARLDAWRAPMNCGRSHALELLLESLPEVAKAPVADEPTVSMQAARLATDDVVTEETFTVEEFERSLDLELPEPVVVEEEVVIDEPVFEEPAHVKGSKKKHK